MIEREKPTLKINRHEIREKCEGKKSKIYKFYAHKSKTIFHAKIQ
jgi:hypothetical protein